LRNFAEAFLQVRFPNHGGLTNAALVHLRLCIVKVAIAAANVRAAMPAVGMSAPVAYGNAHASKHALSHSGTRTRDTRSGGHKAPCCGEPHLQKRFRSRPGTDVARNKSGGRKPPWFRYRDCTGVRQHTVSSLPQLCGSVLASTLPESRQAYARRSWPGARTRLTEKTLSVANALSARTAG